MFEVNGSSIDAQTDITVILHLPPYIRGLLILINIVILVFGLFGNILVIIGSKKYSAIRMDRISIRLIENLAITDIFCTMAVYVATLCSLLAKRWVLGRPLCFLQGFFVNTPFVNEALLIAIISLHRLSTMHNPLSNKLKLQENQLSYIIAGLWLFSFLFLCVWVLAGCQAYFDPYELSCDARMYATTILKVYTTASHLIVLGGPMVIICVSNVLIVKISTTVRKRSRPSREAVQTISLICIVYISSYLPTITDSLLKTSGIVPPVWFAMFQKFTLACNLVANPIIYTMTQQRFKRFLLGQLLGVARRLGYKEPAGPDSPDSGPMERSVSTVGVTTRIITLQNGAAGH